MRERDAVGEVVAGRQAGWRRRGRRRASTVRSPCRRSARRAASSRALPCRSDGRGRARRRWQSSRQAWCENVSDSGVRCVVTAVSTAWAIASKPAIAVTLARGAERQLRIENRDAERGGRVAARHLHVRRRIGDDRVALRLAAGAGGRGHADHRQQRRRRPCRSRDSRDISPPLVSRKLIPLAQSSELPPPSRDDRVDAPPARRSVAPCATIVAVRVRAELVKSAPPGSMRDSSGQLDRRGVAGLDDARVGDEQRAVKAEIASERPVRSPRAHAEDRPRARAGNRTGPS